MTMDPPGACDRDAQDNDNSNSNDQGEDDTGNSGKSSEIKKKLAVHKSRRGRLNFLDDPPEEWTYDRQIAMYLLKNHTGWYTQTPKFSQQEELNDEIGKEKDEKVKEEQEQHHGGSSKDDDSSAGTGDKAAEQSAPIDTLDEFGLVEKRKKRSAEQEDEIQRALNAEAFAYPFTESPYHGKPSLEKAWACKSQLAQNSGGGLYL